MGFDFRYIYGPVPSWRLGSSLGIDLLSQEEKICNFDCIYCQIGPTLEYVVERKIYVSVEQVLEELKKLPKVKIDYITFSGRGEPTLAKNLGESIKAVKLLRKEPVAVLTNSMLLRDEEVSRELSLADFVIAKLDACSFKHLQEINKPADHIVFGDILNGIKEFKKKFQGKLALQMMFMDCNKEDVDKYIYLANSIMPDEVQINTPLRKNSIKPLKKEEILKIKDNFNAACKNIEIVTVYDKIPTGEVFSISDEDTLRRRGKVK